MDSHLNILMIVRWLHLVSASIWVGVSFFMNFVLSPALRRVEGPAKTTVMLPILERAAFWLRWGSLSTYLTGWAYLLYMCYGVTRTGFHDPNGLGHTTWGQWISVGVILGTVMIANVWFVIWPAQKKIIACLRGGRPAAELAATLAHVERIGKINFFLVVPLLFTMGAASHYPVMNGGIVAAMLIGGFALAAHLLLVANRIFKSV